MAQCVPGSYGIVGQFCTACPFGASCPGGELYTDLVLAQSGFWREPSSSAPAGVCPPFGSQCVYVVPCLPSGNASCLPGNICAAGYTGDRCSLCADGFYRFNSFCQVCPSSPYAVIVIFVLVALLALGASYALNKSGISLTLIAVGVDYAQVRIV